jgi:hypothetical protein
MKRPLMIAERRLPIAAIGGRALFSMLNLRSEIGN